MTEKANRKKPGPRPIPTTFVLENVAKDVNCRVIENGNTLMCDATDEEIVFDRGKPEFEAALTKFLECAAQAGVIRMGEVMPWADYLLDEGKIASGRRKVAADRARKVYGWARYDFEAL